MHHCEPQLESMKRSPPQTIKLELPYHTRNMVIFQSRIAILAWKFVVINLIRNGNSRTWRLGAAHNRAGGGNFVDFLLSASQRYQTQRAALRNLEHQSHLIHRRWTPEKLPALYESQGRNPCNPAPSGRSISSSTTSCP